MRRYFIILLLFLLVFTGTVSALANYSYVAPGTFYWNSTDKTLIQLQICGGGGSGKGSWYLGGVPMWGYGGSAGNCYNYTSITVTPSTLYPIVVASGGAQNAIDTASSSGGTSTAFGYSATGGVGGLVGSNALHAGGNGSSTFVQDWSGGWGLSSAEAGQSNVNYTGGTAGSGYASGGGGGPNNGSALGMGYGGAGGQGIVNIYDGNASGFNYAHYTANPLTTGVGNIITFTDESIINDIVNLTYLWDFGDGTTSPVKGTVTHVYSSYGTFSTNLTITSDVSTNNAYKEGYILITNVPITAWYTQKHVQITIVDAYGNDLPGSNITINYISNSLPSKDVTWLTSAFGISQTVANAMVNSSVAMQGYTGSDGAISFMMFPEIRYGITVSNISTGLSKYVEIYPRDDTFQIFCPLPSQAGVTPPNQYLSGAYINITEPNSSFVTFNFHYADSGGITQNLTWNITYANGTVVYDPGVTWGPGMFTGGGAVNDNFTVSTSPRGTEYYARYRAELNTSTTGSKIEIVGISVIVKGASGILVPLGIENWVTASQAKYCYNLISVCILFFIAAFSSPRKESTFCVLIPITAGILLLFGWIQLATAAATQGFMFTTVVLGLLGVIIYMNDKNTETHGTIGPGNKLVTVALFIAFFSVGLTLASGFNLFPVGLPQPTAGTCVSGMSCDAFNNVDFQTMSGTLSRNGGLGGDIVSSLAALPGASLTALMMVLNIVVGVFVLPVVLNGIMEGIWPGISSYPQYMLFLGALEVAVLIIYIVGIYELISGRQGGTI